MSHAIPDTLDILGHDPSNLVVIWSRINKKLYRTKLGNITIPDLIQWAGKDAVSRLIEQLPEDKTLNYIKADIAELSRQRELRADSTLGVGVWNHPVDDGLLVLSGRDCISLKVDGLNIHATKVTSPLIGNQVLEFGKSWVDMAALIAALEKADSHTIADAYAALESIVALWHFTGDFDCMLVASMAIATMLQATWEFRPQVSITGGSYSGKSRLLKKLMMGLCPYAFQFDHKSSAAGITQSLGKTSIPVFLDEQEKSADRAKILQMIRSSTDGSVIVKGSGEGTAVQYNLRSIFWMAATENGLRELADVNRFINVVLQPPKRSVLPSQGGLAALGVNLLASVIVKQAEIAALTNRLCMSEGVNSGEFGRFVEVFSLPVAIWATFTGSGYEDAEARLLDVLAEKSAASESKLEGEHVRLLDELLAMTPRGQTQPLSKILQNGWVGDNDLHNFGVRRMPAKNGIFFSHPILPLHFPLGAWAGKDLRALLLMNPGAIADRQRLNDRPQHGVTVPLDSVFPPDDGVDEPPF